MSASDGNSFLFDKMSRQDLERMAIVSVWDDIEQVPRLATLSETHFRDPVANAGYRAIVACVRNHRAVDLIRVSNHMQGAGEHEQFKTLYGSTIDVHLSNSQVTSCVEKIRDLEARYQAKQALLKIAMAIEDHTLTVDQISQQASTSLTRAFAVANQRTAIPLSECMRQFGEALKEEERLAESMPESAILRGYQTGYTKLDESTGGIYPGEPVILGGATSMGKSSVALTIALNVATGTDWNGYTDAIYSQAIEASDGGGDVYWWSGEMDRHKISRRVLARRAGVRIREVRSGHVEAYAHEYPTLYVDDETDINVDQLESRIRAFRMTHPKLRLIVVDYIQQLTKRREYQEIAYASNRLRILSQSLHVGMLGLSQITTEAEKEDRPPELGDLEGSGTLKKDGAQVWMIHRPNKDKRVHYPAECVTKEQKEAFRSEFASAATLYVRKNRDGGTGPVPLRWDDKTACYTNPIKKPPVLVPYQGELLEPETPEEELRQYGLSSFKPPLAKVEMEQIPLGGVPG